MRTITPYKFILQITWIAMLSLLSFSCEEFVAINPPTTALTSKTVFSDDATATASILGIYEHIARQSNGFASGSNSITMLTGLSSDEFLNHSTNANQAQFFTNELQSANILLQLLWSDLYNHIYAANAILEGLNSSEGISQAVKSRLTGEAKFIRAFCNFYLVNTFGQVPLITSTDYRANSIAARSSEGNAYDQIVSDLLEAESLLSENYDDDGRIRPNRLAASALLARVYLYTGDWINAELQSTKVITNPLYLIEPDPSTVFLKESQEAIWQIQPVLSQWGVFDAYYLIITSTPRRVSLSNELVGNFETDDLRREAWIGSETFNDTQYYFPLKYKESFTSSPATPPAEHLAALRLAEQFLIRSEARAQQGDISGAQEDLNVIRARAGLPDTNAADKASLLTALLQENKIEFFAEWGHRWLDLKRTEQINSTLETIKPGTWQSSDQLYPVPQNEIKLNSNLLPQNNGY